jgi:hypothetical protein
LNGHNLKPIKLSFRQTILWRLKKLVCWQKRSHNDTLYEKAKYMIRQDLNMFRIVQSIQKIKASLSVLIGPDSNGQIFNSIKKKY